MSVINDMLRDLDARQAPERARVAVDKNESLIEPSRRATGPIFAAAAIIIVLLAVFIWYAWPLHAEPDSVPSENPVAEKTEAPQEAVSSAVLPSKNVQASTEQSQDSPNSQTTSTEPLADQTDPEPVAVSQPVDDDIKNKPNDDADTDIPVKAAEPAGTVSERALVSREPEPKPETVPQSKESVPDAVESAKQDLQKASEASEDFPRRTITLSPMALDQQSARNAARLFKQGASSAAYRDLYRFIADADVDLESRSVLAGRLLQDGRTAEAGDILVAADVSGHAGLRKIKARWFQQTGKPEMALHTLRMDIPPVAQDQEYSALLAAYYQKSGYPVQAADVYAELVRYAPDSAKWWLGLAIARDRAQQYQQAERAYQRALALPGLSSKLVEFAGTRLKAFRTE